MSALLERALRGADLSREDCDCRAARRIDRRERSHMLDVVRTAAELSNGRITEAALMQAARLLEEPPS